jgi:transposase
VVNRRELKVVARTRQHHADVHELLGQGHSKAAIARELDLHPATVRKFANATTVDSLIAKNEQRASILDGFHEQGSLADPHRGGPTPPPSAPWWPPLALG